MPVVLLNKSAVVVNKGAPLTLTAQSVPPSGVLSYTWTSDNIAVATVAGATPSGVLTILDAGYTNIHATNNNGDNSITSADTRVTVISPVVSVSLDKTSIGVVPGASTQSLTATVLPASANQAVFWYSSNPKSTSVDQTGNLTFNGGGTATITVTTQDGAKTATCSVTVGTDYIPVVSLSFGNKATVSKPLTDGTYDATVTGAFPVILPANATIKTLNWLSSNINLATVDSAGIVTLIGCGLVTITAFATESGKSASVALTITSGSPVIPITGITITLPSPLMLGPSKSLTLGHTVAPSNAVQDVFWSYPSSGIVTVNSAGSITANSVGTAVVTATSLDGTKKGTLTINVTNPQTGFFLSEISPLSLSVGATKTINSFPIPLDATTPVALTWTSSNVNVATITNTGLVTGVAFGQVTLTATPATNSLGLTAKTIILNVLPKTVLEIDLFNVTPQGYTSMNGLVKTVTLMRDCPFNIPAILSVPPESLTNYQLIWTATPSDVLDLVPQDGANPSCNVTVKSTVTAPKTVVLKATTSLGGFTDSITLVVPVYTAVNYFTLDTYNVKPFGLDLQESGSHDQLNFRYILRVPFGTVVYLPFTLRQSNATNATNTTLIWSIDTQNIFDIVQINGPKPGFNLRVSDPTATGVYILTVRPLAPISPPNYPITIQIEILGP